MNTSDTTAYTNTLTYSSGDVTVTSSGGPTLQFYSSGTNSRFRYYASSQKAIQLYKLAYVDDSAASISLNQTSLSLNINESATLTASTTGTEVGTISWATSDSSVASLSAATGESVTVTAGSAAGSATITATCTIDTEVVSATCTVAVVDQSAVYSLLNTTSDLIAGQKVIFAYNSSITAGALSGSYLSPISDSTFSSDKSYISSVGSALVFTVSGSTDAWIFTCSDGVLGTTAAKSVNLSGSGTTTWTVSISSGTATVTSTTSSYGILEYNTGSPRFTTYASGQSAIQIYALTPSVTDRVQSWINDYLHLEDYTSNDGYCADSDHNYYAIAKAALLDLGSDVISEFQSNTDFEDAQLRYEAWARANNDATPYTLSASSTSLVEAATSEIYICVIVILTITSLSIALLVIKKRKTHNI